MPVMTKYDNTSANEWNTKNKCTIHIRVGTIHVASFTLRYSILCRNEFINEFSFVAIEMVVGLLVYVSIKCVAWI